MLPDGLARQNFGFDTAPLKALVATLPILAVIAHECEQCSD